METEYEVYPKRLAQRSNKEGVIKIGLQTPRVSPIPARLTRIFDTFWTMLPLRSTRFRSSIGTIKTSNFDAGCYVLREARVVNNFQEDAEVTVGDLNMYGRGLLAAGYDE